MRAEVSQRSFKTTDAARYLGVSASWLRKLRMRGVDDPGHQGPRWIGTGDLIFYTREDLDAWLESLAERPRGVDPRKKARAG